MRIHVAILLPAAVALVAATPAPASAAEPLATCFWEGPISMKRPTSRGFDGRLFNFPEESATYWMARFRLPAGSRLRLRGRYARARYQSINAYSAGEPTDALADLLTAPDPGSVNPFVAGNRRDRSRRAYTVTVLDAPRPSGIRAPNTLYAQSGSGSAIELFYRVYEPDRGSTSTAAQVFPSRRSCARTGRRPAGPRRARRSMTPTARSRSRPSRRPSGSPGATHPPATAPRTRPTTRCAGSASSTSTTPSRRC